MIGNVLLILVLAVLVGWAVGKIVKNRKNGSCGCGGNCGGCTGCGMRKAE